MWAAGTPARAQQYPSRPVHIVVPLTPGAGVDNGARLLADKLGQATGQSFVVENRPGASSIIGTAYVTKAAPDGYT